MANIYLWFSSQLYKTVEEDLDFVIKHAFNAYSLDLSANPYLKLSKYVTDKLKYFVSNWWKFVIHMPNYLPINTQIKEVFEWVKQYFLKVIETFNAYNIYSITFHTWFKEQIWDIDFSFLINNIHELKHIINWTNIHLSVENDDYSLDYPLCYIDDALKILKNTHINFTYDIWHANTVWEDLFKSFDKLREYIDIIHLHNNFWKKDEHNSLDKWNINIKAVLKYIFDNIITDTVFILETFPYESILASKNIFLDKKITNNKSAYY